MKTTDLMSFRNSKGGSMNFRSISGSQERVSGSKGISEALMSAPGMIQPRFQSLSGVQRCIWGYRGIK